MTDNSIDVDVGVDVDNFTAKVAYMNVNSYLDCGYMNMNIHMHCVYISVPELRPRRQQTVAEGMEEQLGCQG